MVWDLVAEESEAAVLPRPFRVKQLEVYLYFINFPPLPQEAYRVLWGLILEIKILFVVKYPNYYYGIVGENGTR